MVSDIQSFISQGQTIAESAPHSVDMLLIVSLWSTEKLATDPLNSTAWLSTSLLNSPHSATMTSFPVTPGGNVPVKVTCATGGTWNQLFPVAQIDAASVLTTAVPKELTPPYILL
jgi:hypothetical protein